MVCPRCGHYLKLSAGERLKATFDDGAYRELNEGLVGCNPIDFPGYDHKIEGLQERTGLSEAVVTAIGFIGGTRTVVAVLDSRFLMGSMGVAVGEKITRAIEYATDKQLPLVIYSASGGARMQEGIFSLMQMAKTSEALARHASRGLMYISVMTHPTTGGVTASFASLGDIIIAEPHALIGFAGPRVIEQTINQKLPEGFQRSEELLHDGFLDMIVERDQMRPVLVKLLSCSSVQETKVSIPTSVSAQPTKSEALTPAERLGLARDVHRPHIYEYIDALFTNFIELHGDRCFRDDRSIVGGVAHFHGVPVMVIGHRKGAEVSENIECNFGMPDPEGYRKVQRLVKLADRLHWPVITFVDTPGAYPGVEAEQRGQGEAIARCLFDFANLTVPVISVVVGEGGSGGALALAEANAVIMLENAVYSVLSPEGFATILWKDRSRASEACKVMKITADDLKAYGIVEEVIAEGPGGVQHNRSVVFGQLDIVLTLYLARFEDMDGKELRERRYNRFRAFGTYADVRGKVQE